MSVLWWLSPALLAFNVQAQDAKIVMEEFMIPSGDFEKLTGTPYKRYVQIGEGTHTVIMEKNRMQLLQSVQQFLDEDPKPNQ